MPVEQRVIEQQSRGPLEQRTRIRAGSGSGPIEARALRGPSTGDSSRVTGPRGSDSRNSAS